MFVLKQILYSGIIKSQSGIVNRRVVCFGKSFLCKLLTMEIERSSNIFDPPDLEGMKILDRDAFKKVVSVPCLSLNSKDLKDVVKKLKKYFLKVMNVKPIQSLEESCGKHRILLDPVRIKGWQDLDDEIKEELLHLGLKEENLTTTDVTLKYENWNASVILKSILPKGKESISGYSVIGHIVHLNLRDHVMEYKDVIGQVLLDKVKSAKTVVNKVDKIDNEYRNFKMELLCGENNFVTQARENQIVYEFDFSSVYWNPRLSTEHSRVVNLLNNGDILFDLFCGVGPFVIPAAKKDCIVFGNDLNPESYKWLEHNLKLNKVHEKSIKIFNKDAKDFILNELKLELTKLWCVNEIFGNIHIVMNLPALAIEFMKHFKHLFNADDFERVPLALPTFHVYCFVVGEDTESLANELFFKNTNLYLNDTKDHKIHFVRNVSTRKDMLRLEFTLPKQYLFKNIKNSEPCVEPLPKKLCQGVDM